MPKLQHKDGCIFFRFFYSQTPPPTPSSWFWPMSVVALRAGRKMKYVWGVEAVTCHKNHDYYLKILVYLYAVKLLDFSCILECLPQIDIRVGPGVLCQTYTAYLSHRIVTNDVLVAILPSSLAY